MNNKKIFALSTNDNGTFTSKIFAFISIHQTSYQVPKKTPTNSTLTKVEAKTITPKNDNNDEWESF